MGFVQHIKAIIMLENGGELNSQEENEKKNQGLAKKFPALYPRSSESGHLVQIFDEVSVIWGFFSYQSNNFVRKLKSG
jgi:hypothetical protein